MKKIRLKIFPDDRILKTITLKNLQNISAVGIIYDEVCDEQDFEDEDDAIIDFPKDEDEDNYITDFLKQLSTQENLIILRLEFNHCDISIYIYFNSLLDVPLKHLKLLSNIIKNQKSSLKEVSILFDGIF